METSTGGGWFFLFLGGIALVAGATPSAISWFNQTKIGLEQRKSFNQTQNTIRRLIIEYRTLNGIIPEDSRVRLLEKWIEQERPLLKNHELDLLFTVQDSLIAELDSLIEKLSVNQ